MVVNTTAATATATATTATNNNNTVAEVRRHKGEWQPRITLSVQTTLRKKYFVRNLK
jgi:hypothetical protein